MYSMLMTRTSSRVMGCLMSFRMYLNGSEITYSPKIMRKPLYASVCRLIGINTGEFELDSSHPFILEEPTKITRVQMSFSLAH